MIFDEKVFERDFTPEGQARRVELEFIANTLDLMKEKADPALVQNRVGYILMGLVGVIYGTYPADENAPIPLPKNPQSAAQVREMWKSLIVPTKRFCQISSRKYDEKRLKCILLRMHDRLFQSMRNSIFC